ncbi:uncharacterized protein LOC142335979 [Convolutriloba macropyga]|uniref:uncharacterized protein LOC142335979 n=1 Tax=Convolutriloba macropyga TaxID=536237 RepID=UPI003F528383
MRKNLSYDKISSPCTESSFVTRSSRLVVGDVIDNRAEKSLQLTQSLSSLLSSSSHKLTIPGKFQNDPCFHIEQSSFCKCPVCYNVFVSGEIATSETFGVPDYNICDRTNRLDEVSRLQEGQCWKCRSHCWQNYSLSYAWMKKRKGIPKYKRKPHKQLLKLPEIYEQKATEYNSGNQDIMASVAFDANRPSRQVTYLSGDQMTRGSFSRGANFQAVATKETLRLPPIRSNKKLAQNMLPQTVVAEVLGVVPSLNFHYNEKTDAQMRWLLIKASMKRLIKMDNEKKLLVKESFATMARDVKLMEQQKEEEELRLKELEAQMKLDQTKESVVRKIRLSKFKNSMEKVLKDERDRKAKEEQLSEARRKLLMHKIDMFRHEIEAFQKSISLYFFPRTTILLETKRTLLRRQLFEPEKRPPLFRSQSSVCVRDQLVDSLWMEPQIDSFLTDLGWLNELILNKLRTDFVERVSNAYIRPMKTARSKSSPCPLRNGASYRYSVIKRQGIEGLSKTVESVDWGSEKEVILNPPRYSSMSTGLDNVTSDTNVDVIYNSFLYIRKQQHGDKFSKRNIDILGIKSSQMPKKHSFSQEPKRVSSAPLTSKKLEAVSRSQAKVSQRSIVLDLRNLRSYDTMNDKSEIPGLKPAKEVKDQSTRSNEKLPKTGLKFKRVSISISRFKQLSNEVGGSRRRKTEEKATEQKSNSKTEYKKSSWGKIKTAVKVKTMFDAQQRPANKRQVLRKTSLVKSIVNEEPEKAEPVNEGKNNAECVEGKSDNIEKDDEDNVSHHSPVSSVSSIEPVL